MSELFRAPFREIWLVDFEFHQPDGETPTPICMVAYELRSRRTLRLWQDELQQLSAPPFSVAADALFVAYYASAELNCFLSLRWQFPARVLDLYVEFRNKTNGTTLPVAPDKKRFSLVAAMCYHGLDVLDAVQKDAMRGLAQRGGPYSDEERAALLDYCQSDVVALAKLLPKMARNVDLPRALLRGRYMAAAARIEYTGTPIDLPMLGQMRDNWIEIQERLVEEIDRDYGIYDGRTFKRDRWCRYLAANDIPWPFLDSGIPDLCDDTFRKMAQQYPKVAPIRELRQTLSQMRLNDLSVGLDGRNRCLLSAFSARTGRNQPSNSRFIFGPSCWLRGLIKPRAGRAVAYIDWEQQEFGIAAALSGDKAMTEAYASGDPYLTFAIQAGAAPQGATKESHFQEREQFKICALAVQYRMGAESLARSLGVSDARGRELLRLHRQTYFDFWEWTEGMVDCAMLGNSLRTVFGWTTQVGPDSNPRSLANFPVQGNGAEMLRLACCLATERGIAVCAPVHDALLIEAPLEEIGERVADTQHAMDEASRHILPDFGLRTDVDIVRWPDRYQDKRGVEMWDAVVRILDRLAEGRER